VKTVRHQLLADLKQLIGVPQDFGQFEIELGAYLNLQSFPLRLCQLHGGASQSVEIHGTLGGRGLPGKADQTGDERFGAANVLADLSREWPLLGRKLRTQQHVRIAKHGSDGIVQFMRGTADQLTNGSYFFRLQKLGLKMVQLVVRFPRALQQLGQLSLQQALSHQHHNPHHECSHEGQCQSENTHARGHSRVRQGPGSKQGQGKYRNHAAPRNPHAIKRGGFRSF